MKRTGLETTRAPDLLLTRIGSLNHYATGPRLQCGLTSNNHHSFHSYFSHDERHIPAKTEMKLDRPGTRFNAFFQTSDVSMREGITPTYLRPLQSTEMGEMKTHIQTKSFERIVPSSSIVGDANPRKLKSCRGLSGFMLVETFRSPDPTNLEFQPPPIRLPEQVSVS